MILVKSKSSILIQLACFLIQLCLYDPSRQLTAAAPAATNVLVAATNVIEEVTKREANSYEDLRSRVEQAVSTSLSQLNINVNENNLAGSIVKELISGGLTETCPSKCKPRSQSYVADLFLKQNADRPCISLDHISIEKGIEIYAVVYNSTCNTNLTYQHVCATKRKPNEPMACSWETHFTKINFTNHNSADYFPHYMFNVECHGCPFSSPHSQSCTLHSSDCAYEMRESNFDFLRKQELCDEEGYEVWIAGTEGLSLGTVNGGCDCKQIG